MPSTSPSNALSAIAFCILENECTGITVASLPPADDVFAGRVDVDAVRRLGRRQVVDEPGAVRGSIIFTLVFFTVVAMRELVV